MLKKKSSMLDPIQTSIPSDVWSESKELLPHIRSQILRQLSQIIPEDKVLGAFIIGTITGHQYTPKSDIDINVFVPKDYLTDEVQNRRKKINGKLAIPTAHPINFFLQEKDPLVPSNWGDSKYGVYDLLNKKWVVEPGSSEDYREPKEKYRMDLLIANSLLREFERLINLWKEDQDAELYFVFKGDKQNLNNKRDEVNYDFKRLVEFVQNIDKSRKEDYKWGFGIPRENYPNVVFKLLSHSKYDRIFEYLKEIKNQ